MYGVSSKETSPEGILCLFVVLEPWDTNRFDMFFLMKLAGFTDTLKCRVL